MPIPTVTAATPAGTNCTTSRGTSGKTNQMKANTARPTAIVATAPTMPRRRVLPTAIPVAAAANAVRTMLTCCDWPPSITTTIR